jgi:hypothetical protein
MWTWEADNFFRLIDPTSLDGRNLPDYPSFIFDLFEMVVDTFEMQRQYLSSSMTIFNLIIQLIATKGHIHFSSENLIFSFQVIQSQSNLYMIVMIVDPFIVFPVKSMQIDQELIHIQL